MSHTSSTFLQCKLYLIMGPMFSGKTSELIRQLERYSSIGIPVLAIKHSLDKKRYDTSGLYSHSGNAFAGFSLDDLEKLFDQEEYKNAKVIGIDEGTFFDNLVPNVIRMVETDNKVVYVSGLNGSYQRTDLGQINRLIPLADDVQFLSGVCTECCDGTPGVFTHLNVSCDTHTSDSIDAQTNDSSEEISLVIVGGADKYRTVCRKHYLSFNNK